MIRIFLFLTLLCAFTIISAQPTIDKILETDTRGDIINSMTKTVTYHSTPHDDIVRVSPKKIALYTNDMSLIWKYEIDKKVKSGDKYNFYETFSLIKNLYVTQFGASYRTKGVELKIYQFDYQTGLKKETTITEKVPLRRVNHILEFNSSIILCGVATKGFITPYGSKITTYQPLIRLDESLKMMDSNHQLPPFLEGTDFNLIWEFHEQKEDQLIFSTFYMLDKKGNPTNKMDKSVKEIQQFISVNRDLEIEYLEKVEYEGKYRHHSLGPMKYPKKYSDPYKVYVDDLLWDKYRFFGNRHINKLIIEKGNIQSKNLVQEVKAFMDKEGLGSADWIVIKEIVQDPINESITLVAQTSRLSKPGHKYGISSTLCITLDRELNVVHMTEFSFSNITWSLENYVESALRFSPKIKRTWGELPDGYKKTGMDFIRENDFKKYIVTLVNLEDSQLVLIDDFANHNTRALKFTK